MTYAEAKAIKFNLETAMTAASKALGAFPRSSIGLTPDHVKESFDWQLAKLNSEHAFSKLRAFNTIYLKAFVKEIKADRKFTA
jgi:hypothetical protein